MTSSALSPFGLSTSIHTASETDMRKSGRKCRKLGSIDTQLWVTEWRRLHPFKPIATVADNLGAPVRTVEKWFTGQSSPSLTWVGPIFSAYGAEFVLAGMRGAPAWLHEAARNERRRRLAEVQAAVAAEFSDLEYAEGGADELPALGRTAVVG